jgi:hypothetical protein
LLKLHYKIRMKWSIGFLELFAGFPHRKEVWDEEQNLITQYRKLKEKKRVHKDAAEDKRELSWNKKSYIKIKMITMNENYMIEDQEITRKRSTSRTISCSCKRQAHAQLNK